MQDVHENGEAVIDVVIATHRHRDHVYGFEQKAWEKVKVSEVWMPWTEHRTNPEAVRIRSRQAKKALRLVKAFRKIKVSDAKRRELLDLVENSAEWKNARAMNTLHNGFVDVQRRRFLPTRGNRAELKPRRLPGVKVHVLGPSRKESVIREMDPPDDESFLRLGLDGSGRPGAPFDAGSVLSRGRDFHRWFHDMLAAPKLPRGVRPRSHDPEFASWWMQTAKLKARPFKLAERSIEDDPMLAAVALDKAVNGTSLMLVFEIGRAFLLFPGDAKYGTWEAAMEHPGSREILEKTTFLKVGHHGSHNATPKSFIEGCAALEVSRNGADRASLRVASPRARGPDTSGSRGSLGTRQ